MQPAKKGKIAEWLWRSAPAVEEVNGERNDRSCQAPKEGGIEKVQGVDVPFLGFVREFPTTHLGRRLVFFFRFDGDDHLFGSGSSDQFLFEIVVFEQPRDAGEGFDMRS